MKVLVKQISLICFRAYLEVYVAKNPTCFSRWSIRQHHNTKYCPDCKKNMRKKQRIAAHKKYEEKANQEHEENIIRIRNSNARIAAIVIEAEKAGLTYGNYMRLKGGKQ